MPGKTNRFFMTSASGKELGHTETTLISGLAALLSHLIHHPLYTLKSHMMTHGKDFKWQKFGENISKGPLRFLYRGKLWFLNS